MLLALTLGVWESSNEVAVARASGDAIRDEAVQDGMELFYEYAQSLVLENLIIERK